MFKPILLFSLAIVLASASLGIDTYLEIPETSYQCLVQSGVELVIYEIWNVTGGINQDFVRKHDELLAAGIKHFDAFVDLNQTFTPEELCSGLAHALPSNFKDVVWLYGDGDQNLWDYDYGSRLLYVEEIAKTCQAHGVRTGIFSSAKTWAKVMGYQSAGSPVLQQLMPVWYVHPNGSPSFGDWHEEYFGTWKNPNMKEYSKQDSFCRMKIRGLQYF